MNHKKHIENALKNGDYNACNTAVIIRNEYLPEIVKDNNFGKKLVDKIVMFSRQIENDIEIDGKPVATVICNQPKDCVALIAVGDDYADYLCPCAIMPPGDTPHNTNEGHVKMLKRWAYELGYDVIRRNSDE